MSNAIRVPDPDQQILFGAELERARKLFLMEALLETVVGLEVTKIDRELAKLAPKSSLGVLASKGLRGELAFPVPYVLASAPRLLGYYRLLVGASQKEFYQASRGLSQFRSMEFMGVVPHAAAPRINELCAAFSVSCARMLSGLNPEWISQTFLRELGLLTYGPQLRGGANNRRGQAAIREVFELIREVVAGSGADLSETKIELRNAAGRTVQIEFAPDPDIIIREVMADGQHREILAIEVKGGRDTSNIHNRLGEAEKSHLKAKAEGYAECWTVVNVDKLDRKKAKQESPSTTQFYDLFHLVSRTGKQHRDFCNRIASMVGVTS